MKTISRYIMTLALLLTAVGGAWADEVTVTFTQADLKGTSTVTKDGVTLTPGNNKAHNDANLYEYGSTTFSVDKGKFTKIEIVDCTYGDIGGWQKIKTGSFWPEPDDPFFWWDLYTLTWTGEAESVTFKANVYTIQSIVFTIDKPDVDVTTNKAENDTVFTEAWFNMPAFDATAEYELVRDMSIQMTATMGDGTDGVRYRVKKAQQGEGYEPVDLNMMQVLALVAVNDGIEQKALTLNQDYYCRIYKLDEQTLQPEGDGVELIDFDFAPGLYALKAFAQDDSDYAGETALSNTFQLFQGYEVEVAAKEFITYYKDEALKVDESTEGAELYTVSSVNDTQVVLSSAISVAPEYTPLLVYNTTEEKKTFLLVPTDETADEVTPAAEFKGTLEARNMGSSSDDVNYYVCDGTQFVWVRSAGTIAANRCWLEISTAEPAGARAIVFSDATGVNGVIGVKEVNDGSWYDLNGRKLNGMPTKKGIYVKNGRKVVVK